VAQQVRTDIPNHYLEPKGKSSIFYYQFSIKLHHHKHPSIKFIHHNRYNPNAIAKPPSAGIPGCNTIAADLPGPITAAAEAAPLPPPAPVPVVVATIPPGETAVTTYCWADLASQENVAPLAGVVISPAISLSVCVPAAGVFVGLNSSPGATNPKLPTQSTFWRYALQFCHDTPDLVPKLKMRFRPTSVGSVAGQMSNNLYLHQQGILVVLKISRNGTNVRGNGNALETAIARVYLVDVPNGTS
jgi:hypothetical protein